MSAFKTFEVVIPASPLGEGERMKVRDLIPAVAADKPSPPPPPFVRGLSLAPKVLCHFEPGASPQEFELLRKQALKARFNRASQSNSALVMNRAFSAGVWPLHRPWGVAPGSRLNTAPLALNGFN